MILRLMLHLLGCKKETKMFASSGNRTRAARVAGEHSTTEPTMLTRVRWAKSLQVESFTSVQKGQNAARKVRKEHQRS